MGTAGKKARAILREISSRCVKSVGRSVWLDDTVRGEIENPPRQEEYVSRSLNKVMLIGNLDNDPEVRSTTGGNRVATFSLATSRSWNDASGSKQEKTEWHRCVVWNTKSSQLADIVERYVKKGDKLYVEGRIEYRQWQDKDGQTRYSTEINVRELIMLGGARAGGGDFGGGGPPG